jgi:type I restriction enzyme, S subunit
LRSQDLKRGREKLERAEQLAKAVTASPIDVDKELSTDRAWVAADGWIPMEWNVSALNDSVRMIDCKHLTSRYVGQGFPVVRPRNVNADGPDLKDIEYVTVADHAAMTDVHVPRRKDIVPSRNASFGVAAYVNTEAKFAIGQNVVVMTQTVSDTRVLFYCLSPALVSKQIDLKSAKSTFSRINLGDIRALTVSQPTANEQIKIADVLLSLDSRIDEETCTLGLLNSTKSGLMDELLTGRVCVTPLLNTTDS